MGEAEEQLMLDELQDSLEDIGYNKVLIIVYPSLIFLYTLTKRVLRIYGTFFFFLKLVVNFSPASLIILISYYTYVIDLRCTWLC